MGERLYYIRETPDKGKGMFAARSITRGACILSESPLLYVGKTSPLTNAQVINTLSEENRKVFFSLSNAFQEDPLLPHSTGIIRTNALPLGRVSHEGAVYPTLSRINHSCVPNAMHTWNPLTMKGYINATREIPADSEIFLDYMPLPIRRPERRAVLQEGFRFTCRCEACIKEEYEAAMNSINESSYLLVSRMASDPERSIEYVREALAQAKMRPCYFDGYQHHPLYCDIILARDLAGLLPEVEMSLRDERKPANPYDPSRVYSQLPRSR
ncbi:MAG: hypothetical protein J3Q66DRAFT_279252 [Benniella sp.]|nr:MAG: hypothetical protein J3Q66DRAFT_279252 [Benniella sp.]